MSRAPKAKTSGVKNDCLFFTPDFFACPPITILMPIKMPIEMRRLSLAEFGAVAFEVMRHIFLIHNEIGRFFDETIYKRELARRMSDVRLEVPIEVTFDSFMKRYFVDVLVGDGAVFEFKAVEALSARHRAQLLHYLLLCDLAHGKVINVRSQDVQHEFVNTRRHRSDRATFEVGKDKWNQSLAGATNFCSLLIEILRDLGTGLSVALYEEAITHFFGVPADVSVMIDGQVVGNQPLRLLAPGIAFKITAFGRGLDRFENHARRLLAHVDLQAIAWANINMSEVTFTTLTR